MNKKFWLIIVLLIVGLFTSSCQNEDRIMKDYPGVTDINHIFKEVTVDEVLKKIKNEETFYLVMGFPECPWCQALMPVLNDVAKEYEDNTIYYLNIKEIRDNEESTGHSKYLELEENYFNEAIDLEKNRLNAPTFVKVKSGMMRQYHLNTVDSHVLNENNVLPPLNDDEISELKDILRDFFE